MKSKSALVIALMLASLPAAAADWSIISPDRPPIWYNPVGMKVSQNLEWEKGELVLHLAYDRVEFTPSSDQSYYDTFKLSFPTIHLDGSTKHIYFQADDGRKVDIGRLESSV